MPKSGPRPHCWKVQGELNHEQYIAWLRMKAQAQFRKEPWALSFEEFQGIWHSHWDLRGRGSKDYCLTRVDPEGSWSKDNTACMMRCEHLRRQRLYRSLRKKWRQQELMI